MKLESKLFDRIRIRPPEETHLPGEPDCEWAGCTNAGSFRAPKGRMQEGQYHRFCLDHVRLYNKSYNYFAGMKDDDIAAYQKDSVVGHRPTWSMGARGSENPPPRGTRFKAGWEGRFQDKFGIFGRSYEPGPDQAKPRRELRNMERKSFAVLDLEGDETGPEIKARYKALVKRLHPDANGGDRSTEDRLREIIQAYGYLKAAGFC
jgi:curved DNA-binding protein CbpA